MRGKLEDRKGNKRTGKAIELTRSSDGGLGGVAAGSLLCDKRSDCDA